MLSPFKKKNPDFGFMLYKIDTIPINYCMEELNGERHYLKA